MAKTFVREFPVDKYPYLIEHAEQHLTKSRRNDVREFEFGLDLILDGLEKIRDASVGRSVSMRRGADRSTRRLVRPRRRGR